MQNKASQTIKKIKTWAQKSPVTFLIGLFFTIILAVPTGIQVYEMVNDYYHDSIGWKKYEQEIINKLAPTQTKDYFDSVLGEPITIEGGNKYTEAIYKRKDYWVQAVYDKNFRVQLMSIMVCSDDFKPEILETPLYKSVTLGKDTMKTVSAQVDKAHYSISGATAPTYFIDEVFGINPTKYQTVYFGTNDACPYDPQNILKKDFDYYWEKFNPVDKEIDTSDPKIDYFRSNMPINIIGFTAPHVKAEELTADYFFLGPDYTELRVLPGYNDAPRRY